MPRLPYIRKIYTGTGALRVGSSDPAERKGYPRDMSIPENNRGARKQRGAVTNLGSVRPFRMYAQKYLEAGWEPLPLPAGDKFPPPTGFTGRHDTRVDSEQIERWMKKYDERANLGFRPPPGVLGIDVDQYPGKSGKKSKVGGESLAALTEAYGELPPTWVSTARTDGISGIRWFRVPAEFIWRGKLGLDIESVWHRYRFAVAPPSLHPELKSAYLWYPPGADLGSETTAHRGDLVRPEALPELPEEWVDGLQSGLWEAKPYDNISSRSDLKDWILERPLGKPDADGKPQMCTLMRKATEDALEEITSAGSAHEALNLKLYYLLSLASEGHGGIRAGLAEVRRVFLEEVTDKGRAGSARGTREAVSEYERSRDGAVRVLLGAIASEGVDVDGDLPDECTCYIPSGARLGGKFATADPNKYGMTELDNAYFMADMNSENLRWLPKEGRSGEWVVWDAEVSAWYKSGSKLGPSVGRLAQLAAEERFEAAKHYLNVSRKEAEKDCDAESDAAVEKAVKADADVKRGLALFEWGLKCKSNANKVATVNQLKEFPQLTGDMSDFDADPMAIQFPNGIMDLRNPGNFRPVEREDYVLRRMRFDYVEDALSSKWEDYLESSIPDPKIRDYLHRLAGYTLLGRNNEKKVIFLIGESNSGKSVFNDVMRNVFGTYGHTFDLALMRSKKESGPRSDLLNAVPARYLAANESSKKATIHADELKRLTGGDEIAATAKFSNEEINATPAFTPWISSQEIPHIEIDKAIKNRVEPIVFPNEFKPRTYPEGGFSDHLLASSGMAVTAWLVDGLRKYHERGLRGRPVSLDGVSEEFALNASGHLGEFVQECLRKTDDSESYVLTQAVTNAYEEWCRVNEIDKRDGLMRANELGRALTKLGIGRSEKKWIPEMGKPMMVRFGVEVINNAEIM